MSGREKYSREGGLSRLAEGAGGDGLLRSTSVVSVAVVFSAVLQGTCGDVSCTDSLDGSGELGCTISNGGSGGGLSCVISNGGSGVELSFWLSARESGGGLSCITSSAGFMLCRL